MYVISNRDVSSLRQLDLWLELVDTQDVIPLFQQTPREYTVPHLNGVDWTSEPTSIVDIARDGKFASMEKLAKAEELWILFRWLARFNHRVRLLEIYNWLSTPDHYRQVNIDALEVAQVMLHFLCECPFLTGPYFRSDIWLSHKESLSEECSTTLPSLLKELILSSEVMESFVKEPFMTALDCMTEMTFQLFGELVETISLSVHSADLAMELLFGLQKRAHDLLSGTTRAVERFTKSLLGIALDHIGEAISVAKVKNALVDVTRVTGKDDGTLIECRLRIDQQTAVLRVGDHVQLVAASPPSNATIDRRYSMDVLVEGSERGKAKMRCIHHPPPFLEECSWKIKNCGSFVTSKTMLDAVVELYRERELCSILYQPMTETGPTTGLPTLQLSAGSRTPDDTSLNESQLAAVSAALSHPLCLLWGPPGTGKTRTIVAILIQLLLLLGDHSTGRVLVTAPTHNAVDNVLRKFIELRGIDRTHTTPLRVSTDVAKVSEDLRPYTCDAMMGKDINEHFAARKKAARRIKDARLIFTTCIGAGLGLLRGESFDTVLVDEASQQTEPASLVPLTKGCAHAVLVGDHVQLRATVQMQSVVADFDVSLFESLYEAADAPGLAKVMIDVQYRMHRQICAFSSKEFYQERLKTAVPDNARPLPASAFAWPTLPTGQPARMVLIPCAAPEDIGQKSKSNRGQALVCREVCSQLLSFPPGSTPQAPLTVAVLTPYSRQRELLKQMLPKSDMLEISSIDGYQGREADVVVFVTTRCNVHGQLGFLSDMRRLNVTMTRAKAGVVIIGHKETLCGGAEADTPSKQTWGRLLASCQEMAIESQK